MLYLVSGYFDNCKKLKDHLDWVEIYGITDSLELGKKWIREKKQEIEDKCNAEIENQQRNCPEVDCSCIGIDIYEEHEKEDEFYCNIHIQENLVCCLSGYLSVKKVELNTNLKMVF